MGIFSSPDEAERKAKLKKMEDKRVAFAQSLQARGFKPERMLLAQTENGGLVGVCRFDGKSWLIVGPGFGADEDFALEGFERFTARAEEVHVKSEGLGGIFGFGKKGQHGVEYHITRADGSEAVLPFVVGRNSWAQYAFAKNPLLSTRRRRGDANIVWDLRPIETNQLDRIMELASELFDNP